MKRLVLAGIAVMLLSACDQAEGGGANIAEASATGEAAANAVENAVAETDATPLEKTEALALMERRHEDYERIGDAMKVISRELKGDSPNLADVRQNAAIIAELAPQIPDWFPAGTGPDVGKTDAKAAIWENRQDFAAKAQAFNAAAQRFNTAAGGGDVETIRAAHADLGKSCKACHDLYREKD